MSNLDAQKDVWLDVCREFIDKEFGGKINLWRADRSAYLTALRVGPAEGQGGHVIMYFHEEKQWIELEDWDAFVNMRHDGEVSFSYPVEDPEFTGMYFKVGHPREASELLHLLVNPKTCTATPANEPDALRICRLGDLVTFKVIVPCKEAWKLLDPKASPAGEPKDLRRLLHANVTGNWDAFVLGEAIQASKFAERWPEYVGSLPEATADFRAGYLMNFEGMISSAVVATVENPSPESFYMNLSIVPRARDLSYLYLRELIAGDVALLEKLKAAFPASSSLEDLIRRLEEIEVSLPAGYHQQIRLAAEHVATREWVILKAISLARRPGDFQSITERNRQYAVELHNAEAHPDWVLKAVPREFPGDSSNCTEADGEG